MARDFKEVLSEWDKGIIYGLPVKKCIPFVINYYELLDISYAQYLLCYLATKGFCQTPIMGKTSKELLETLEEIGNELDRLSDRSYLRP